MRRLPLESLLQSAAELHLLSRILSEGGVVAIPTDTFYGLAANPFSEEGVRRIFEIKSRDDGKSLPVLFSARTQLVGLGVTEEAEKLDRFFDIWPAPLTVVFQIQEPIAASRGRRTLAVRLPAAEKIRSLLDQTGPLTGTSANRTGDSEIDDPDDIEKLFVRSLDVLVDGGVTPGGKPSTLVDAATNPPSLLRAGAFAWPLKP